MRSSWTLFGNGFLSCLTLTLVACGGGGGDDDGRDDQQGDDDGTPTKAPDDSTTTPPPYPIEGDITVRGIVSEDAEGFVAESGSGLTTEGKSIELAGIGAEITINSNSSCVTDSTGGKEYEMYVDLAAVEFDGVTLELEGIHYTASLCQDSPPLTYSKVYFESMTLLGDSGEVVGQADGELTEVEKVYLSDIEVEVEFGKVTFRLTNRVFREDGTLIEGSTLPMNVALVQ